MTGKLRFGSPLTRFMPDPRSGLKGAAQAIRTDSKSRIPGTSDCAQSDISYEIHQKPEMIEFFNGLKAAAIRRRETDGSTDKLFRR